MDPDQALKNAREAVAKMNNWDPAVDGTEEGPPSAWDLKDAFEALDEWLTGGGFLPQDWKREQTG